MNIVELNKIKGLKGDITPPPDPNRKSVGPRQILTRIRMKNMRANGG